MKNKLLPFLSVLLLIISDLNAQTWDWGKQSKGVQEISTDIHTDFLKNTYITGRFISNATFDDTTLFSENTYDAFLVKYDSSGNVKWAFDADGNSLSIGYDVTTDQHGNCYLTGEFMGEVIFGDFTLTTTQPDTIWHRDIFLLKISPDGKVLKALKAGGKNDGDRSYQITKDQNDGIYVTGGFSDTAYFGNTYLYDKDLTYFLAKYDTALNFKWVKKLKRPGYSDMDGPYVTIDPQNKLIVAGMTSNRIQIDTLNYSNSRGFINLIKSDEQGNVLWHTPVITGTNSQLGGVAVKPDGDILITGYFVDSANFGGIEYLVSQAAVFIAEYTSEGIFEKVKIMNASGGIFTSDIEILPDEKVLLTGYLSGQIDSTTFGSQNRTLNCVLVLDKNMEIEWFESLDGSIGSESQIKAEVIGNYAFIAETFDNKTAFGNFTFIDKYSTIAIGKLDLNSIITAFQNISAIAPAEIYPNPFTDHMIIEGNTEHTIKKISVFSSEGKIMTSYNYPSHLLDLSDLQRGLYFIQAIYDDEKIKTFRAVKN